MSQTTPLAYDLCWEKGLSFWFSTKLTKHLKQSDASNLKENK